MTRRPQLLVAGHCTIDDIHHADGREVPGTFGGAAAYASLGATIAGADVTLVTLVGEDYPVERLRDGLGAVGRVDATHVRELPGRSAHNDAWYGSDGSRRFDIESWERLELLTPGPDDIPLERARESVVLVTPASVWQQRAVVDDLLRNGCRVALDTELHYLETEEKRRELLALARRVRWFLPSIEHLEFLFGVRSGGAQAYVQELAELGCELVAVKHGASGSTILDLAAGTGWRVPALAGLRVEDTTGAGDGYGGGFLAALASGCDPAEAACWGTIAASFVVESVGARVPDHFSSELAAGRLEIARGLVEQFSVPVLTR